MAHALRLSIALAATLVSAQANAATLTTIFNDYYVGTSGSPVTVPQAPDAVAPVLVNTTGAVASHIGTAPGYKSPWQFTQSAGGTLYEPIGPFTAVQASSSGEILFGTAKDTLQLAWGSPDTYNTIEFWLGAVHQTLYDVTGLDLTPPDTLLVDGSGVNFVTLFVLAGFDKVVFKTSIHAFELANVRAPGRNDGIPDIPLPAGLILLLSGLTGLGFLGRVRAKAA